MRKIIVTFVIIGSIVALPVVLLLFTDYSLPTTETAVTTRPAQTHNSPALAEKIGQLFIIGHWSDTLTSETSALVDNHHLGGVIIMDATGDPRILRAQTAEWQNVSYPTPLLIGIDQEGGVVSRLKDEPYELTAQPDITRDTTAYEIATKRARALLGLGINSNYAPVIDRSTNSESFMYDRVFRNPNQIASLGDAMVRGYQNTGLLAIPKHYPGHPDTADDSHTLLPVLEVADFEEYEAHTQPFADLLQAGNTALLMTAHVQVPLLDPVYPATLSPAIITDLRERIGYEGIIVSDDLAMQAVSDTWSYEESAVLALRAGVDMIMLAAEPESASSTIAAVITAVQTGELSEERIDEAYGRVQIVKERLK